MFIFVPGQKGENRGGVRVRDDLHNLPAHLPEPEQLRDRPAAPR